MEESDADFPNPTRGRIYNIFFLLGVTFIITSNASTFVLWETFGPTREELTRGLLCFLSYRLFTVHTFIRKALTLWRQNFL